MKFVRPTSRITMPDGAVFSGSAEECARFWRAAQGTSEPKHKRQARGDTWSTNHVATLMRASTTRGREVLKALRDEDAASVRLSELAPLLDTTPNALAPVLTKIARDAKKIGSGLPAPFEFVGRLGSRAIQIDPLFKTALEETPSERSE